MEDHHTKLEKIHEHHIIPKYKCEELGIDKDFTGNTIYLTRLEHAWIHWHMWCNEKKDVYDLLESKGVDLEGIQMPNSTGCIKNHIPWHDTRDIGATQLCALGEIDGIDMSGENNPNWIDGRSLEENYKKAWNKEYNQRAETKARLKKYRAQPEVIAKRKKLEQTPKRKAYKKAHSERPEIKAKRRAKQKEYYQRPEIKSKRKEYSKKFNARAEQIAKRREYQNTPEYKAKKKELQQTPEMKEWRRKYYEKNKEAIKEYYKKKYHRKVDIQYFINQGLVL
jgi:hypothetical protein